MGGAVSCCASGGDAGRLAVASWVVPGLVMGLCVLGGGIRLTKETPQCLYVSLSRTTVKSLAAEMTEPEPGWPDRLISSDPGSEDQGISQNQTSAA